MLNLPGTASHAVACLDGNPLTRNGKSGSALFMLMFSSFCGASVGILAMILFSPLLSTWPSSSARPSTSR